MSNSSYFKYFSLFIFLFLHWLIICFSIEANLDHVVKQNESLMVHICAEPSLPTRDSSIGCSVMDGKKLKIVVPVKSKFVELVNFNDIVKGKDRPGFSFEVFQAAWDAIPCKLRYQLEPWSGTYDELCEKVHNKTYDLAVGDITIKSNRTKWVDFTLPYLESKVTTLVKIKENSNRMWTFLKPFSWDLWLVIFICCSLLGVVVRILERRVNEEFKGPAKKQITSIVLFPFQSVLIPQRDMVTTCCARVVLITWLVLAFVIMQSYTANLSAILTVDRLQGRAPSLAELRRSIVGYQNRSFVKELLIKELSFDEKRVKPLETVHDYYDALQKGPEKGGVAAIFDETPYLKVFFMHYTSGFTTVGPTYKTNGLGFAFPLDSTLTPIVSRGILNVTQGHKMSLIEKKYFNTEDIYNVDQVNSPSSSSSQSLTTKSFGGLFIISGVTTILALIFNETSTLRRVAKRYMCNAASRDTISRGHSVVETPVMDQLQENSHDQNLEMIEIDPLGDRSNPENRINGTSDFNQSCGDAIFV